MAETALYPRYGRFAGGVVLYDGETSASFGDGLHAVPLRALWEA